MQQGAFRNTKPRFRGISIMTTLPLRAGNPANRRRDVTGAFSAVAAIIGSVFALLAQAEHESSEARSRFPAAD
jgi:hypothetical protein